MEPFDIDFSTETPRLDAAATLPALPPPPLAFPALQDHLEVIEPSSQNKKQRRQRPASASTEAHPKQDILDSSAKNQAKAVTRLSKSESKSKPKPRSKPNSWAPVVIVRMSVSCPEAVIFQGKGQGSPLPPGGTGSLSWVSWIRPQGRGRLK